MYDVRCLISRTALVSPAGMFIVLKSVRSADLLCNPKSSIWITPDAIRRTKAGGPTIYSTMVRRKQWCILICCWLPNGLPRRSN